MAATGRKYGFSGSITAAASKTIWGVTATAAVRPAIYEIILSSNTAVADNAAEWNLFRFTAAGTSTAVVPEKADSGDPAATSVCGKNHSVEPTYTVTVGLCDLAVNQHATVRWVAAPDCEFVAPATAANGFGFQCQGISNAGFTAISQVSFKE